MFSPFTQTQRELLLIAAGLWILLAGRGAVRALSSHADRVRLTPFALVILSLAGAFVTVVGLETTPFFLRHVESVLAVPVVGCLTVLLASIYDEKHKPPAETQLPSRLDLLRTRWAERLHPESPPIPPYRKSPVVEHLKSLARFYVGSEPLRIVSTRSLHEVRVRLLEVADAGEVWIREKPPGRLTAASTRVRGNILPVFTGKLTEQNGHAVLEGRIEMDKGIFFVLGVFSVLLFIVVPLQSLFSLGLAAGDHGFGLLVMFIWLGMLEAIYHASKESPAIITRNLEHALRE